MDENVAKRCLAICPLFEGELLLELILRHWNHPFADEELFRQQLLETATEVLMTSSDSSCQHVFIDELPPQQMNFISAIWYVEFCAVQDDDRQRELRERWLAEVRRCLPSCFCPLDLLEP
ncbi:MAG: hypothetical protein CMJ50_05370 [Planctomycetaceae bacterium]|nr:hypothetical protein [Planctomycetaceae bacterium]